MGKRGPKPVPTPLKLARGTHRVHKHGEPGLEPVPPDGKIQIPAWAKLGDLGRRIWHDTIKRIPEGLLTTSDVPVLVSYCKAWVQFLEAEETLKEEGRYQTSQGGLSHKHPAIAELESARAEVRRLAAAFGMTPADRSSIQIEKKSKSAVVSRSRTG